MTITAGVDVGTGAVKAVLFDVRDDGTEWLAKQVLRVRQRDPLQLAEEAYDDCLGRRGSDAGRRRLCRNHR